MSESSHGLHFMELSMELGCTETARAVEFHSRNQAQIKLKEFRKNSKRHSHFSNLLNSI